jgi:hypothetical protein
MVILVTSRQEFAMTENTSLAPKDVARFLASLRRPGLLIRAARFGLVDYRRERDLRRLIGVTKALPPRSALLALAEAEAEAEETRRLGDSCYSVARHVGLLIALLGEARLVQAQDG